MKDRAGNELRVDDEVYFIRVGSKTLSKGRVVYFTPKGVTIEYGSRPNSNDPYMVNRPAGMVILPLNGRRGPV